MLVRVEVSTESSYGSAAQKRRLMQKLLDVVADWSREEQLLIKRVAIVDPPKPKRKTKTR